MYTRMSNQALLLLLGIQTCLIQTIYSQCADLTQNFANIALPNNLVVGYDYGNNNMVGYNNMAIGFHSGGPGYQVFAPNLVPGGAYGGKGSGLLRVIGELPVVGTSFVKGHVPIIGAVQFSGKLPAIGKVIIIGSCGCCSGCNVPYVY